MQNVSMFARGISKSVQGRSLRRRQDAPKRRARAARLFVEGLEGRQLMATGLDPTFGWGGLGMVAQPASNATTNYYSSVSSVALQDSKVVTVGTVQSYPVGGGTTTSALFVARLNSDGTADTSFGTNGYQTIAVAAAGVNYNVDGVDVVVQPDGKIVALGTATPSTGGGVSELVVARFNANGSVDNSFGTSGQQLIEFTTSGATPTPISATSEQLALAPNGAIVVVGHASPTAAGGDDFAIARLTSGGALDTSFHGNGMTTVGFDLGGATGSQDDEAQGVVVQPDGKIVVVGSADMPTITVGGNPLTPSNIAVARLNVDGSLDSSFNGTGKLNFGYDLGGGAGANGEGEGVALLSGGQILIVGDSYLQYSTSTVQSVQDVTVTQLTSTGAFDTAFNGTGKYTLPLSQGGGNWSITASAITVEPTGNFLVGGDANAQQGSPFSGGGPMVLAELTPAGTLNPAYGTGGVALLGLGYNSGRRLLIDSNGKAVFAAYSGAERTTAPAPQVVSADAVTKGGNPKAPVSAISIVLNTDVDPKLVTNKKNYRVRIGTRGRRFVKVRKVIYNAATHTLTLVLSRRINAKQAAKGLQVLVKPGTIIGLDGQPFNTALPINVRTA